MLGYIYNRPGSVILDYQVQLLLPIDDNSKKTAETELLNRLEKRINGMYLKNLHIDEKSIIIGQERKIKESEKESNNWKVVLASAMSVIAVILIVLVILLICYYLGWCRKSSYSSEESWSDNQSFRPFTSAPYNKKRHWQDAPSLSSASSRSAFSRRSSIQQRESMGSEESTVDWNILRGFIKKNEKKSTDLHRNMGPNTWVRLIFKLSMLSP